MKLIFWVDHNILDEFCIQLSNDFYKIYPLEPVENENKNLEKFTKALNVIKDNVIKFRHEKKPGIYKKAYIAYTFSNQLIDKGYDDETVAIMKKEVLNHLSA